MKMEDNRGEPRTDAMERLESLMNDLGIQVGENEEHILPSYDWDSSFDFVEFGDDWDECQCLLGEWLTADPSWHIEDSLKKINLLKKKEKKKYRGPFTPKNSTNYESNLILKKDVGVGTGSEPVSSDEDYPYKDCYIYLSDPEESVIYLTPQISRPNSKETHPEIGNQGEPCKSIDGKSSQVQYKVKRKAYNS